METKKSKYDTNPLDPDVERKAEESWGDSSGPTQQVGGATREVGRSANEKARQNVYSEAPTRRYDNPPLEYPSVFVPPTYSPPAQYQRGENIYQPPISEVPTSRPIPGIGISEKVALVLPYIPFYIGIVPALIELFLVPRKETKIRFHASQALALHISILIIQTIFGAIKSVTGSSFAGTLFYLAALVFMIISIIRVSKGEPHQIAPLKEPAQWFNQHIEPRNQG